MSEAHQNTDPLASSRARDAQLEQFKAEAQLFAATAAETATPREVAPGDRAVLERIVALGGVLFPLKPGIKKPSVEGWKGIRLTVDEAVAHLAAGGNVGVHLGASGLIALDAENAPATQSALRSGFRLTVAPAKSRVAGHPKEHGSHVWLRVPEGINPMTLHTRLQVQLDGGGVMDVLAGGRYAVAPPSRLTEAPGWAYSAYAGSPLDLDVPLDEAEIATAPLWLFDAAAEGCPAALEPLRGVLAPRARRDLAELDARTVELTAAIDQVPWPEWLQADPRLTPAGEVDGCGCEVWSWSGAEHSKSATLHDACTQGSGAHIWSGTMQNHLGLGEHVSRLDLACALRGESRATAAASVGIRLGGEQELTPVLAEDLEADADAAETRGDRAIAERLRARAAVMRSRQHEVAPEEGAVLIGADSVVGAPAVSEPTSKKAPVIPIFSKKNPTLEGLPPAPAFGSISAVSTPSTSGANALAPSPAPAAGASPLAGLRSGAWLDEQVFAPLEYHVPGLIVEGCGIIAGPPKVGKSWFVLAIALAIAAGDSALGCIDCVARPVLYLALEDGWRRLRARSRQLLGDGNSIPAGIEFMLDVPEGATAVSVINEWLALYPGQKPFVIVDTLGKTRGAGPKSGASAYQEDYKAVGDLKRCVDAVPGSGMLIVHHTRKPEGKGGKSADFVEELSGTFGLSGAADYAMVLHRDRETEGGILAITGRDVIERTLAMTRDADTGLWTLDGGSVEASAAIIEANRAKLDESRLGGTSQEIIEAITVGCPNPGDTVGPKDIADAIGATPVGIAKYLTRLLDGRYIDRPERGRYAPVAAAPGTAPAS